MGIFIKKRERNLLIRSESSKAIPWLRDLMKEHTEITHEMLQQLTESQRVIAQNMKGRLIEEAMKEWVQDGYEDIPAEDLGDKRIKCSLCGNPDNKLVFYIRNTRNHRRINVGSQCIKLFGDILSLDGKTPDQYVREATNAVKRLRREAELDRHFPGIASMIHGWRDRMYSFPVVIPSRLASRYFKIGELIKEQFDNVVSCKPSRGAGSRIADLLAESQSLLESIDSYVAAEEARTDPFVAKRHIFEWLQREGDHVGVQWLKEEGTIRHRTAFRICEPSFMDSLVPLFNRHLSSNGLTFKEADSDKRGYIFSVNQFDVIDLFVKHRELVSSYGAFLTDEEDAIPSTKQIVEISEIVKKDQNVMFFMQQLNKILARSTVGFIDSSVEYNRIYASNRVGRLLYQLDMSEMLRKYKGAALLIETLTASELEEFVKQGTQVTMDEYERFLDEVSPQERGKNRDLEYVFS